MTRQVVELDLRGLKCPLPVLRTRKALRRLAAGDAILLLCTDPLAAIDIPHLVRSEGHRLDAQDTTDGVTTFRITKREAAGSTGGDARSPLAGSRSEP